MSTSRICPRCGGHFDVANWICPHCGAEFARPKPTRPGWLQKLAPERGSLTKGVIACTCLVFLLQMLLGARLDPRGWWVLLVRMGGIYRPGIEEGQIWRLVTHALLHVAWWHILFNVIALLQVGPLVEQAFGRARFVVLYFGAAVAGGVASHIFHAGPEHFVGVGASGALCGFIGVMAVWGYRRGGLIGEMVKTVMLRWALFILVFGLLMSGVDNAAHAGGFVGGALMAFVIAPKGLLPETPKRRRLWNIAAAAVLLGVLVCVVCAAVFFHRTRPRPARTVIVTTAPAAPTPIGEKLPE
jgi:rhomboid protease GluP